VGIGGTAKDAAVVAAEKAAMKRYRAAEDLYKRGEFFGISEEIHVHALGSRVAALGPWGAKMASAEGR